MLLDFIQSTASFLFLATPIIIIVIIIACVIEGM